MSGPVPSPSIYGTMGWSGTLNLPWLIVIFAPSAGGCGAGLAMEMSPRRDRFSLTMGSGKGTGLRMSGLALATKGRSHDGGGNYADHRIMPAGRLFARPELPVIFLPTGGG